MQTTKEFQIYNPPGLTMKDAAEILNIGHRKLYRILREYDVISKKSTLPKSTYVQAGFFKIEVRSFQKGINDKSYGIQTPYQVTLVTPEGLAFISDILEKRPINQAN